MSLIVDALKKAQQLRLKESTKTPFSTPDRKESLRYLKERWITIGISLASLIVLSLIGLKMIPSSPPSVPAQTSIHPKVEHSVAANPAKNSDRELNPDGNILKSDPATEQRDIIFDRVNKQKSLERLKGRMSLPKDVMNLPKDTPISSKITVPPPIPSSPLKVEVLRGKEIAPAERIEVKKG